MKFYIASKLQDLGEVYGTWNVPYWKFNCLFFFRTISQKENFDRNQEAKKYQNESFDEIHMLLDETYFTIN